MSRGTASDAGVGISPARSSEETHHEEVWASSFCSGSPGVPISAAGVWMSPQRVNCRHNRANVIARAGRARAVCTCQSFSLLSGKT